MPDKIFWNQRYLDKNTGWDLGQPAPPFVRLVEKGEFGPPGRVLIPGAGRSYEGIFLASRGYDVTCVDFAPQAVREAREAARQAGVKLTVVEEDFFRLDPRTIGVFDYLVEHTCFCAIDPPMRQAYVDQSHALLAPGGLLIGLFYAHGREGGPPWTTTEEEVRGLFGKKFDLLSLGLTDWSVDSRKGEELLGRLRRKNDRIE
ncbi:MULTISPECIES: methyltransferase domain-containing protein [Leptospirillum]|jgi:SAM-dependent methyltransferase|uniref:SAM-dependent methyltransferase n=3 Tax=Leptospirillum ferriphilum TaxID=178606 RepID=A0A059XPF2_9BACT|nr:MULTISPECIES: methyltransferase domain-containing protein [Leptospirillum]EAY56191.1 MAG: putative thiopurine S-methyltransferase [Leptospirillum rubarum]EIJ75317.1 MAG: Putative thiopurine S-methyltransferase [Leptospirillum sp. Group II 'C75']AFS53423.1 SAM-dependent methyltransferase [Leptospirillum ferriphilum ML-04]AIA30454.1 SAM-dependent methyltransferase [Leptospirillum ferriphilum YSK]AKS24778.1 SAM-dependent methyltransferase [Leptospirillum sp. Group II 'CF-1']